jgi:hypothetical protein
MGNVYFCWVFQCGKLPLAKYLYPSTSHAGELACLCEIQNFSLIKSQNVIFNFNWNIFQQAESGYGSENNLRRHGSLLSLQSGTSLSTISASSFKVNINTWLHNILIEYRPFIREKFGDKKLGQWTVAGRWFLLVPRFPLPIKLTATI